MPDPAEKPDVTALLLDWSRGNADAFERLVPLVYEELRKVARAHLRHERAGHVLQTTALVHEAYLRIADLSRMTIQSRAHFLAMAGRMMRQILVDHARRRLAAKRAGSIGLVDLDEASMVPVPAPGIDVLALDEALNQLTAFDARLCQVVELRYFAGLTLEETARALEVSHATVERDWALAKAWLHQRLTTML